MSRWFRNKRGGTIWDMDESCKDLISRLLKDDNYEEISAQPTTPTIDVELPDGVDIDEIVRRLIDSGALVGGGGPGTPGQAATIRVAKTITGAPGTAADVNNTGTSNAAVLEFIIPRGADGDPGRDGTPGEPGKNGTPGTNDRDGAPGADGRDGSDGKDGADGKDGVSPTLIPGTATQVAAGTPFSFSLTETTPGSREYRLDLSIPEGAQGESAVAALNPRGNYDPLTAYVKNDYVTANDGNTYVLAVGNSTGQDPTTTNGVWQSAPRRTSLRTSAESTA